MKKSIGIVGAGCSSIASEALKSLADMGCISIPLASSFHEFKSPALAEAYQDSDLTPVGAGYLAEIAGLKDQLLTDGIKIHVPRLAPNKSGYYYLRKLSRTDRKSYRKNFKSNVIHIPLKMWLESEALDMEDFIGGAFVWKNTPEGHDYWEQLDDRMRWAFDIQNNKKF